MMKQKKQSLGRASSGSCTRISTWRRVAETTEAHVSPVHSHVKNFFFSIAHSIMLPIFYEKGIGRRKSRMASPAWIVVSRFILSKADLPNECAISILPILYPYKIIQ